MYILHTFLLQFTIPCSFTFFIYCFYGWHRNMTFSFLGSIYRFIYMSTFYYNMVVKVFPLYLYFCVLVKHILYVVFRLFRPIFERRCLTNVYTFKFRVLLMLDLLFNFLKKNKQPLCLTPILTQGKNPKIFIIFQLTY